MSDAAHMYIGQHVIYDFFRLRNELDRNQFLLGNDNEWIIPDLFKVFYSNTSSGVQSCGSIEPV